MRIFILSTLLLHALAEKECVWQRMEDFEDKCAMYAKLQACEAKLSSGGSDGCTGSRAAVIYRGDMDEKFVFMTITPGEAFEDLLMESAQSFANHDEGHIASYEYKIDTPSGTLSFTVSNDKELEAAFSLASEYGSKLMLKARLESAMPTSAPTRIPTHSPTKSPVESPDDYLGCVTWQQECREQSHEDMDQIINNECVATFGYGARGANYEELTGERLVTGMPETNVCGGWLIGTSNPDGDTDHHGVDYNDCVSKNSRNCWGSGSNMRNTVPNNTCRNSPRKSMCVK